MDSAKEFTTLQQVGTLSLVDPSPDQHLVGCKWVFRVKHKADGTIGTHKATLVTKGYHQQHGFDFEDTFSPVERPITIRIILSMAVQFDWTIHQLDVSNAFLHGDLKETVYMSQPPGFIDPERTNHVCLLHKEIYVLKQAPRGYEKLSTSLINLKFVNSVADPSLFVHQLGSQITVALIYVDDILLTGSSSAFLKTIISTLQTQFSVKDLGDLHYFLGLEIKRDANTLMLSQTKYVVDLLTRFHMEGAKPSATPIAVSEKLSKDVAYATS